MSSFDYHYHVSSKYDGSDVIDTLRSSSDSTKAEAIDWLIDNGFLHSDEQYNAAYVLALGDAIGISDEEYDAEDDKPVGNPKRLGKGVDWRPHEDNFLPSQHDRMRAEYARGYSYERPLILKVAGIGLLTAFALGLLRMDSKEDTTSNE